MKGIKMKRRIFGIVITAVIMFTMCAPAMAAGTFGAVSRSADSVIRLTVSGSFGTEKTTGIVIGKGSEAKYVLACLRSVESGSITAGMNEEQNVPASVIAKNSEKNLAVLELEEEIDTAEPIKFKKSALSDGDEIYVLGYYADDDESNISEGTVLSENNFSSDGINAEIYMITPEINERNGGGMVSDKYGHAVGICYYDGNVDANKVITANEIFTVLDENSVDYKKATIIYLLIALFVLLAAAGAGGYLLFNAIMKKRANRPKIIGISGEFADKEIYVTQENINIGRDAKICQIVIIDDLKVSRCHCAIRYDTVKHSFVLTDLSSTHGTYVNGSKLEPNIPRYITPGTVFNIGTGNTSFRTAEGGEASCFDLPQ